MVYADELYTTTHFSGNTFGCGDVEPAARTVPCPLDGDSAVAAFDYSSENTAKNLAILLGSPVLLRLVSFLAFKWHTRYRPPKYVAVFAEAAPEPATVPDYGAAAMPDLEEEESEEDEETPSLKPRAMVTENQGTVLCCLFAVRPTFALRCRCLSRATRRTLTRTPPCLGRLLKSQSPDPARTRRVRSRGG